MIVPSLLLLKNSEIDKVKWNQCINFSPGGLIYAKSFYLDNICGKWKGLISADYTWVLPICERSKWGIKYQYQPPFTQQLGVFAKPGIEIPYNTIWEYLVKHYKFMHTNWNFLTSIDSLPSNLKIETATNYIIDLAPGYDNIASFYHKDLTRNLKRGHQFQHIYKETKDYNLCISLYQQYYGNRIPHVSNSDYNNFSNICKSALQQGMLVCRQVVNNQDEIAAVALLLNDGRRIYNLMNTTTEAGRKTEANHFLIDAIIQEFAGQKLLLDFEGSDLPGVKGFYENFAPVNQPYYMLKLNNLPEPLRSFKK